MSGKKLRVCIIGDFSDNLDEGLKNIAHNMSDRLSDNSNIDVYRLNVKDKSVIKGIKNLRNFDPQIIHYLPGPTNKSLAILKLIKIALGPDIKIVISETYPDYSDFIFRVLRFKPDYVFSQSLSLQKRLDYLGIPSSLLPNGVDIKKFSPISKSYKNGIRDKYDIQRDKFVLLHVGHLKANRNLDLLINMPEDIQVVIVASKYLEIDSGIFSKLTGAGCKVILSYIQHIEEIYQLSDCYIFPVKPGDSIICPLSIMEAMSCNLPVITTPFEGIRSFFSGCDGIYYINSDREVCDALNNAKNKLCSNRKIIEGLSWENISREILRIYNQLI